MIAPRPGKDINENIIPNILIIQTDTRGDGTRTYNLRMKWRVLYHCAVLKYFREIGFFF
jgi:hypothetical protein